MIGKELLDQLANTGSKFTEADIIFITIDKDGKLIWLERGNELAGFEHIVSRHKEQFQEYLVDWIEFTSMKAIIILLLLWEAMGILLLHSLLISKEVL